MTLELTINNTENANFSGKDIERYTEIVQALISSGGLSGVKSGKTVIHFDAQGVFQRVQLDYYPWERRHNL